MRVLVEAVGVEELVKDNALGWKAVEAVVLVVLVAEFVNTNTVSAQGLVLLFYVELAPFGLMATKSEDGLLHFADHYFFNLVH